MVAKRRSVIIISIVQIINILLFLIVGLFVYRRARNNTINISFALVCMFMATWVLVGMIWQFQIQYNILPTLTSRFGVAFGCMVIASLIAFSGYFPVSSQIVTRKKMIINYGIAIFVALTAFTPLSVKDAYFSNGNFIRVFGPLYVLFAGYVLGGALFVIVNMAIKYRKLEHYVDKQKVKYVVFGVATGLAAVMFFMFVLPYLGYPQMFFIGVIGPLIMVSFTGYAIVRYHALDISSFASKVIVYTTHSIIIAAIIHLTVMLTRGWVREKNDIMVTLVAGVTLIIIGLYLKKIKPYIDHLIQRKAINMSRVLDEFSQELNVLKSLDELSIDIENYMKRILEVENISIILRDYTDAFHVIKNYEESILPVKTCQVFLDYLEKEDVILSAEQIELDPEYLAIKESGKTFFDLMDSELAIPLLFNKKLLGILILGKKKDERNYDTLEYQLLSIVRHDIGVALNNSRLYQKVNDLYEEVTRLNETLEERVAARTVDLQDALSQLKHLDKLKSDFISVASHELRTPLTAVKGAINLAAEYQLEGEVGKVIDHFLDMSSRNIDRLIRLINDILDLSKLEASQSEMIIEQINIGEVALAACESLATLSEDKKINLIKILPSEKLIVDGDRARLTQVIVNLFGNAIKFSPSLGTITIAIKRDYDWMECCIQDEGEGILKENQVMIFEKFSQSRETQNKEDSTGLGLAISKRIIESHHGTIWVESVPGQGSCFKFRIPLKQ